MLSAAAASEADLAGGLEGLGPIGAGLQARLRLQAEGVLASLAGSVLAPASRESAAALQEACCGCQGPGGA